VTLVRSSAFAALSFRYRLALTKFELKKRFEYRTNCTIVSSRVTRCGAGRLRTHTHTPSYRGERVLFLAALFRSHHFLRIVLSAGWRPDAVKSRCRRSPDLLRGYTINLRDAQSYRAMEYHDRSPSVK